MSSDKPHFMSETWLQWRRAQMQEYADNLRELVEAKGWKPRPPWWQWRKRRWYDSERDILSRILAAYPAGEPK